MSRTKPRVTNLSQGTECAFILSIGNLLELTQGSDKLKCGDTVIDLAEKLVHQSVNGLLSYMKVTGLGEPEA